MSFFIKHIKIETALLSSIIYMEKANTKENTWFFEGKTKNDLKCYSKIKEEIQHGK